MILNKMNKLIFICLLSLIILNAQCDTACDKLTPPGTGNTPSSEDSTKIDTTKDGTEEKEKEKEKEEEEEEGERGRLDIVECTGATEVKGYKCLVDGDKCALKSLCELETDSTKCEDHKEISDQKCVKEGKNCKLVASAENSSNILNIFKFTLISLFIFTVL